MPLARRFRKTAAMRGRSSARAVSSSTIEARVTTLAHRQLLPPRSSEARVRSRSRKRPTMRAPARAAASSAPREVVGVGKQVALEVRGLRIEVADRGRDRAAAARNAAPSIFFAAAMSATSARFLPSGKVTSWRTTSPRTSLSDDRGQGQGAVELVLPGARGAARRRGRRRRPRKTRGWRTKPRAWSCRAIQSALAPGGTIEGGGAAPRGPESGPRSRGARPPTRRARAAPATARRAGPGAGYAASALRSGHPRPSGSRGSSAGSAPRPRGRPCPCGSCARPRLRSGPAWPRSW